MLSPTAHFTPPRSISLVALLLLALSCRAEESAQEDQEAREDTVDERRGMGKGDTPEMHRDPVEGRGWVLGYSAQDGRPLVGELFGEEGPVFFLLSAIHGNERIAISYGERVRTVLLSGVAERLGVRIFFVQAANPDGIELQSRENYFGVDLNRNFPSDNFDPLAGDVPLSEPESQMLKLAMDWTDPAAVVSVHCCGGLIDYDGPSLSLAVAMEEAAWEHAYFDIQRLGSRPGSFGSYVGLTLNKPIITIELDPNETINAVDQFLAIEAGAEAAALWSAMHQGPEVDVLRRITPAPGARSIYDQLSTRRTDSSNVPIRVDLLRQPEGARHHLLLSGIHGKRRTGENVAEHLRRQMISDVGSMGSMGTTPFKILTLANPDGLQSLDTTNLDGIDVLEDALSGSPLSAEGIQLAELLEDPNLDTVYLVEDHERDGFKVSGPNQDVLTAALRNTPAGVGELSLMPQPYASLAASLAAAQKNVVVVGVDTEHYEDQYDIAAPTPAVYWALLSPTF